MDPDSIPEGELEPDLMVLDVSSPTDMSREDNFINIMVCCNLSMNYAYSILYVSLLYVNRPSDKSA